MLIFCTYLEHICNAQRYTETTLTTKCRNKVKIKPDAAEISLLEFSKSN